MNPLLFGLLGLFAILLTSKKTVKESPRVLLIGDSLAVGLRSRLAELAASRGIPFEGHGIVGSRIDQWAKNPDLDGYLSSFRPTLILVSLGTNDEAANDAFVSREEPFISTLLEKLKRTGAKVVWIGPPTLPFPRKGVSDMVKRTGVTYFPSETLDIVRGSDRLHPTPAGYSSWADVIWRSVLGS